LRIAIILTFNTPTNNEWGTCCVSLITDRERESLACTILVKGTSYIAYDYATK